MSARRNGRKGSDPSIERRRRSRGDNYTVPKDWIEVWTALRRKRNVFAQGWTFGAKRIKPKRRATVFGSTLCSIQSSGRQVSSGYWPRRHTRCLGDEASAEMPSVPPEWLSSPPTRHEEAMTKAIREERWVKEMFIERKLKALCRRSGNRIDVVFDHYDADGSGELDIDEFQTMVASIGDDLNKRELSWLVRELSQGRKRVTLEEFKRFVTRSNRVGVSSTVEWRRVFADDFCVTLRKLYDPKRLAPRYHPLYTLSALARRDALKFDPVVRRSLDLLWKKIDLDRSGRIEEDEYVLMHEKICRVMAELGKLDERIAPGGHLDLEAQQKLAVEDWEIDNQGFGFVDYTRFVSCWFQIADQFTESITVAEYDVFLCHIIRNLFPEEITASGRRLDPPLPPLPPALPTVGLRAEPSSSSSSAAEESSTAAEEIAMRRDAAEAAMRAAAMAAAAATLGTTVASEEITIHTESTASSTSTNSGDLQSSTKTEERDVSKTTEDREVICSKPEKSACSKPEEDAANQPGNAVAQQDLAEDDAEAAAESILRNEGLETERLEEEALKRREDAERAASEAEEQRRAIEGGRRIFAATVIQRHGRGVQAREEYAERRMQRMSALGASRRGVVDGDQLRTAIPEAPPPLVEPDGDVVLEAVAVLVDDTQRCAKDSRQVLEGEAPAAAARPRSAEDVAAELESWRVALRAVSEAAARRRICRVVFSKLVVPARRRLKEARERLERRRAWIGKASKFYGGTWSDDDDDANDDADFEKKAFATESKVTSSPEIEAPVGDALPNLRRMPCVFCKARAICVCCLDKHRLALRRRQPRTASRDRPTRRAPNRQGQMRGAVTGEGTPRRSGAGVPWQTPPLESTPPGLGPSLPRLGEPSQHTVVA